jgi:hypothetical protein
MEPIETLSHICLPWAQLLLRLSRLVEELLMRSLKDQIHGSYVRLNFTAAIIGLIFPAVLWAGGTLAGLPLRSSMSAYYWATKDAPCSRLVDQTNAKDAACQKGLPDGEDLKAGLTKGSLDIAGTMRNYFVGLLFAVAAILFTNRGHSFKEDIALTITGVSAVLIALFPMPWREPVSTLYCWVHWIATAMFFTSIAFVSGFCSRDTVILIANATQRKLYRTIYSVLAILMICAPIGAYLIPKSDSIYWVEFSGIWSFAAYWMVKGIEMSGRDIEELGQNGYSIIVSEAEPALRHSSVFLPENCLIENNFERRLASRKAAWFHAKWPMHLSRRRSTVKSASRR